MPSVVYALCAVTQRPLRLAPGPCLPEQRTRLLLWSTLCFAGLTVNNGLLFADLVLVPSMDLSLWRGLTGLGSMLILLYGLIWDRR